MDAPRARLPLVRHRLGGADFARIYAAGRRAQSALFAVVVLENELARTRLGLSVSKRRFRRAVQRNRARRVFREAFRLSLGALPIGVDVVMIATSGKQPALEETREELPRLVARALSKPARVRPQPGGGTP